MKTYRPILLAIMLLAMAITPFYYTFAQDSVTLDNLKFDSLVFGDDLDKDDLVGHVVGVKYMGKW